MITETAKICSQDMEVGDEFIYQFIVTSPQVRLFLQAVAVNGDGHYESHILGEVADNHGLLVPPHMIPGVLANLNLGHKRHATLSSVGHRIVHNHFMKPDKLMKAVERIISKKRTGEGKTQIHSSTKVFDRDNNLIAEYSTHFLVLTSPE